MTPEELLRFCGENSLLIKGLVLALAIAGIIALHFAIAYGSVYIRLPWHKRRARQRQREAEVLRAEVQALRAEVQRLTDRGRMLEHTAGKFEAELLRVDAIRKRTDDRCVALNQRVEYLESLIAGVPLGE